MEKDRLYSKCLEEVGESNLQVCIAAHAVAKKDASLCAKVGDVEYADVCYSALAKDSGDSTLCDKILDPDQRNSCYATTKASVSYCDEIKDPWLRRNCIYGSFKYSKDMSLCDRKDVTKNLCMLRYAVANNDPSVCSTISDSVYRDDCYMQTAEANANPQSCLGVFLQDKNWCLVDVALMKNDESICRMISSRDKDSLNWCLAALRKDMSMCDSIANKVNREECYLYVAKELKDASICSTLTEKKIMCYSRLAETTGDISLCYRIENPTSEYICYSHADTDVDSCHLIREHRSEDWYKYESSVCDGMARHGNLPSGIAACRAAVEKYKEPAAGKAKRDEEIRRCFLRIMQADMWA